ncbi:hypothetical protein [Mesorhizobium sp. M0213]
MDYVRTLATNEARLSMGRLEFKGQHYLDGRASDPRALSRMRCAAAR